MKTALHVFLVCCFLVMVWMFIKLDFFMWGVTVTLRETDEIQARVRIAMYRLESAAQDASGLFSVIVHSDDDA